MTDLTPEERERIYQEEKARLEAQKQLKETEDKKNMKIGCLTVLVIFVVAGLWAALSGIIGCSDETKVKKPDRLGAYVMSQQFVIKQLKAPSTAEFPVFEEDMVIPLGKNRFKVTSYVDAQNSFGAMIRTPYTCIVKNTEGDTWQLESFGTDD